MWGNHITRNLDRSTWNAAITGPPPEYIIQLLRHKALASRKSIIEGFLHNNALPPASAVIHYRQWKHR
ncbi:hypothetical protein GQ600_13901 [Phytophthora cactorum]|nr:hypothetical protein GQ600_13901 [Phytophthora cactorum]